jgi:hypothetical protein
MMFSLNEKEKQSLRIRRFAMAVATYCMAMLALFLITQLGMGTLSPINWAVIIGLCIVGNGLFLILFITGHNRRFSDPSLTSEQIIFAAFWGMPPLWALPDARPVILMFFLPAFGFGMLRLNLRQYLLVIIWNMVFYGLLLFIEFTIRRPGFRLGYELFLFILFGILLTWLAFFGGFISKMRRDLKKQNQLIHKVHQDLKKEVDIRRQAEKEKDRLILNLQKALGEIKILSGLLPICANCKKIRDDKGYWNQIESYIRNHSEADFSHSICPDCAKELYRDYLHEKKHITSK